jgi:HTH-type transcriptional regulator/antitoxin HigA
MKIKPIKTESDYQEALKEIELIFDAEPNTPKGDKLEILVTLVEAYEEKHYNIELLDPIEMIKHVMEAKELTRGDLENCIGTRARVSEVLNKKRGLTLPMIRKLYNRFHIPAHVLIQAQNNV